MTKARDIASATTPNANAALLATFPHRNLIINGAMVIDQRNGGASVNNNAYAVDRFLSFRDGTTLAFTSQRSTTVPSGAGFVNSLLITTTTSGTAGAGEGMGFQQRIEGFNVANLMWGTANAKTVTLSFWVRSSLTGTFSGSLVNGSFNRSYPYTFTISSANTWEQKTVTVAGDTSGTWLTDNGTGIRVYWDMGSGTSLKGTANAWASAGYVGATGAVNVVGTSGATFYTTGVQLEVGDTATPFEHRSYGDELARCQRYYKEWSGNIETAGRTKNGTTTCDFALEMRATPTVTFGTTYAYCNNIGYQITAIVANSSQGNLATTHTSFSSTNVGDAASVFLGNLKVDAEL